jgi:hypothetical protein
MDGEGAGQDLRPPENEDHRREVLADPPGMIKEGWSYWFTYTGWKLLLPVVVVAGVLVAWMVR